MARSAPARGIGRRALLGCVAAAALPAAWPASGAAGCAQPVYLTFDTGHMGIADLVAEVLRRQHVPATFFAANERTQVGDGCLGERWAPWWRARAAEGHEFGSHTWQHAYWRGDAPAVAGAARFRIRPSAGPDAGQESIWTAAEYCADIRRASTRLEAITGRRALPLYRAPGGKTSPALLAVAERCGFKQVGWSPAGFLGVELPSDRYPGRALKNIRAGDVLLAHLGIWSRRDPWAPAVLEPLLVGLKERGFCFRTLRTHPGYAPWIAAHGG